MQGATVNGGSPAAFVYDSDGQRIKASWGSGDAATLAAYAGNAWEISSLYQESFSDGLAQGWTASSGAWSVQSGAASNTNAYRALTQDRQLAYRWVATYVSGTNAGLYLFASAGTGTERGSSYRIWQDANNVKVYEAINNTFYERASFAASNAAGATHSYQALYHPQTGVLQVARDGVTLGSWTDTTPLVSGGFLSLRTDGSSVQFDDIGVSEVVKYYIIPEGGYIGGQRVAMRRGGTLYYLHSDHLGSTSVASNSAGAEVASSRVQYYPYGGTRSGGGGLLTEYRFTGQRREPGIGLYDYGARFYEPRIGRFQSPDPIVPSPGDPQSLNRYSFASNNPVRYVDRNGHCGPLTPICLALLLGGMALLLQGDSPDLNITPEDVASQRLGGALVVGGATLTGGSALAGAGSAAKAGATAATAACADGDCTNEVRTVANVAQTTANSAQTIVNGSQIAANAGNQGSDRTGKVPHLPAGGRAAQGQRA